MTFKSGVGPPNPGGTRSGYDQLKSPPDWPAVHDPVSDSGVAVHDPFGDDEPDVNAYTMGPGPARDASDHSRRCVTEVFATGVGTPVGRSIVDTTADASRLWAPGTSVCTRHDARSGSVNTHAGSDTSRNRDA